MSYVVNDFPCLVNIEIPGENMKDFVSNHTPVTGGYFCLDTERFSYFVPVLRLLMIFSLQIK